MSENAIIERYKNALCDDYYNYLNVIDHLNNSIPDFAEGMGFNIKEEIIFDYPEFCTCFMLLLRENLKQNRNLLDQTIIYQIFEQMMLEKILDNINKTDIFSNDSFDMDNEY